MGKWVDGLRDRNWLPVVLWLVALVVIAAVWVTRRGQAEEFPAPLLQAVGMLLTALVFVLSLAQNRLTRTVDSLGNTARRGEDALLQAFLDHPDAVSSLDLWEHAARAKAAIMDTGPVTKVEARQILEQARIPVTNFGHGNTVDRRFALTRIDRELARHDAEDPPTARRRRQLEKERNRLQQEQEQSAWAAGAAGVTASGYRRLTGRARVAELAVRSLLQMARTFVLVMAGVVVIGAIYVGWTFDTLPPVEIWAALVLLALAGAYIHVVRLQVDLEVRALGEALRDSTLLALLDAEMALTFFYEADRDGDSDKKMRIAKYLLGRLDQAYEGHPGLPWTASVRGRLHLIEASSALNRLIRWDGAFPSEPNEQDERDLLEHLRPASRHLAYAVSRSDDPIAALAHARLLQVHATLIEERLTLSATDLLAGDPDQLRETAHRGVAAALLLLADIPIFPTFSDEVMWSQSYRSWIGDSDFLWPDDPTQRAGLARAIHSSDGEGLTAPSGRVP